jgi:hypothetical protein
MGSPKKRKRQATKNDGLPHLTLAAAETAPSATDDHGWDYHTRGPIAIAVGGISATVGVRAIARGWRDRGGVAKAEAHADAWAVAVAIGPAGVYPSTAVETAAGRHIAVAVAASHGDAAVASGLSKSGACHQHQRHRCNHHGPHKETSCTG